MKKSTLMVIPSIDRPSMIHQASQAWRSNLLFKGIKTKYLNALEAAFQSATIPAGQIIIKEGEKGNCLYVIERGAVEIQKAGHHIALKTSGEYFGAMSFIDNEVRSADVIAKRDVTVKILSVDRLRDLPYGEVYLKLLQNHLQHQQALLRASNQAIVGEKKAKVELENQNRKAIDFLVTLLLWLIAYQFFVGIVFELSKSIKNAECMNIINPIMMVIFGLGAFFKAFRSDFTFSFYGVNLHNWQQNLREALLFSGVFLVFLVAFKWLLTLYVPGFIGDPVIDWSPMKDYSTTSLIFLYIGYIILVPVQEFIARGVIQSSLAHLLPLKNRISIAIIVANLFFCVSHIHASVSFAIMLFIPGVFWGLMYQRQKSILGVSVSHIIIGVFTLLCLNLLRI